MLYRTEKHGSKRSLSAFHVMNFSLKRCLTAVLLLSCLLFAFVSGPLRFFYRGSYYSTPVSITVVQQQLDTSDSALHSSNRSEYRLVSADIDWLPDYLLTNDSATVERENEVTKESFLVYKAYYETRLSPPIFRIILNSRCTKKSAQIRVGGVLLNTSITPAEGKCPFNWAPNCKWNAFVLDSEPYSGPDPERITLVRGNTTVTVPVSRIPDQYKEGLTVCVPPLYWFSDWARLTVFFEVWRAQGATRFLFWKHSVSEKVEKILNYYEKKGLAKIFPWTEMPKSDKLDPNNSTYRLTHSLAHMDCTFKADTKWTALNDIDEFVVAKGESLLDFLKYEKLRYPDASAFFFTHSSLQLSEPYIKQNLESAVLNLNGLKNPMAITRKGPPKVIVYTPDIRRLTTHYASRFFSKKAKRIQVSKEMGLLLHGRNNFVDDQGMVDVEPKLFHNIDAEEGVMRIETVLKEVFDGQIPLFTESINRAIGACLGKWRKQKGSCKTPIRSCRDKLLPMEKWIFTTATDESRYYVL